jgi:hypothetical protein
MKSRARFVVLFVLALVLAPGIFAQGITTGTVSGTVTDPSGAVLPNAQIELIDAANGLVLTGISAGDGSFKFSAVPIGIYKAKISASGFAAESVSNVQVVSGSTTNLNEVGLRVGSVEAEQVEVNGSAASLLETADSQVTTAFGAETMQNLPLNNGFDTIVELIPGVVSTGYDNF